LTWKKNLLRTLITVLSACVATGGGSSFDNFVSLVGGLICVPLTLVFPAYFHQKICGDRLTKYQTVENWTIVILGLIGSAACTIASIYQWVEGNTSGPSKCYKS
jgi:amino acid permease